MNIAQAERTAAELARLLQDDAFAAFAARAGDLHPYDAAVAYLSIAPEQSELRTAFLTHLDPITLTDVLEELDGEERREAFARIGALRAAAVMDRMDNDDLADFLGELSEEARAPYLAAMSDAEAEAVQQLMSYPPETAGRIMNNRYVWLPQHYTVEEAIAKIRAYSDLSESISYLYVIDGERRLLGVVSYRDLILASVEQRIADIMRTRVIHVEAVMDQEQVADLMRNYDFLAVPVVDDASRLVGIITVDDIIDVVMEEADEDIQKLSGSGKDIDFNTRAWTAAGRRLPWLVLLLFIGVLSGTIISGFEETLDRVVALAFFMPMIAGMTGNTGTQSLAVVVRGLIGSKLSGRQALRLVRRELGVGLIIGVTCGLLVTGIAYVWQGNIMLGVVVGVSLLLTLILGTIAGTTVPLLLDKLRVDPAVASGPLITTLNDMLSLLIYFGMASLFLDFLL
ncbi:magnesium transporter [Paenibacillus sp. IB182496]|uniref:Magnesium transporter MgtE n=1 Tax=Paenibacillus sabuli TaxID=2772509 RepID=A0A927BTY7_9BACL|nr:magnesium transporter [Paenibacillus sabuli]MBD2846762.1 magnesium transporter [Paenibacillus sabuli]